jgi:N-acetylglucosaminyldiphosphoundecaprenol N-acetyl-beta-D-mannosaminyltransferase
MIEAPVQKMNQYLLKNFNLTRGRYVQFLEQLLSLARERKPAIVCVANVHMFVEAQQNKEFLSIINSAEMVTPDGKPLTWALRLLYGIKQERVAGMDLLPDLLQQMEQKDLSVYFYGGSQAMLDSTHSYIQKQYPRLKVAGAYSPPFRALTENEHQGIIHDINNANPHVIFVILGCPKQEKWMASVKGKINTVMIGVGGALPVMIGLQKRAPLWMQNAGLEWFYRLLQEPGRLFKRYAITNSFFIFAILKELFKIRILQPLTFSKKNTN